MTISTGRAGAGSLLIYILVLGIGAGARVPARAAVCSDEKVARILKDLKEDATASESEVFVECDLTLSPRDPITKRIILEGSAASGVTIDCREAHLNGGAGTVNYRKDMIEIRSKRLNVRDTTGTGCDRVERRRWDRPQNITVKNCRITGSVRVWGMGANANREPVRDSSRCPGHAERTRRSAPRRITLDRLRITGVGRTPLYLAPGVTELRLINSELEGVASHVAVYLDAESSNNTIRNNKIHTDTHKYGQIAIDGSGHNKILNNYFSALDHGGIYLYRNCGEEGTVRHTTPSHNIIVNNVFYYNRYRGDNPAVYLGSRNGSPGYCNEDKGYPYGSSVSDRDYARYNVVMQNQIIKRWFINMIRTGSRTDNPNYVDHNETVTAKKNRLAGCYVANGFRKKFLLHGQTLDVFEDGHGRPICTNYSCICDDGESRFSYGSDCHIDIVPFECRISGDNRGCQRTAFCPYLRRIVGAVAACNLESGTVSSSALETLRIDRLKIVRASDHVSDGSCEIGSTRLSRGEGAISGVTGFRGVSVSCKERDKNGGDCHIRGLLYCQ